MLLENEMSLKSNLIIKHFAANPKDNPLVVTIGVLFGFFQKTLLYHTLKDKSKNNVASNLKVNPFFVRIMNWQHATI